MTGGETDNMGRRRDGDGGLERGPHTTMYTSHTLTPDRRFITQNTRTHPHQPCKLEAIIANIYPPFLSQLDSQWYRGVFPITLLSATLAEG